MLIKYGALQIMTKKINYRVVENCYFDRYNEFVEEYNKGTPMMEIYDKLSLSNYMYRKYRKIALKNNDIIDRRTGNAKYYYSLRGRWIVTKRNPKTNKIMYYGSFRNEEDAKNRVEELKRNNWEIE